MKQLFSQRRFLELSIHIVSWLLIFGFPLVFMDRGSGFNLAQFLRHSCVPLCYFVIFYVNYLWLVPRYMFTDEMRKYILSNAVLILCLSVLLHVFLESISTPPPPEFARHIPPRWIFYARDMGMMIFVAGLGAAIRTSLRWRQAEERLIEAERQKTEAELKNLKNQLNPHFLLNTLNSVQWMARMSKQNNIMEFVQRLKRLLSYNLGKEGMQTTLRTEIDIVKDYIALEQMRYDFVIEMNVEEGRYLEQPTVRMLLQPLVENAIRYGLGDDEKITIQVFEDNIRGLAGITILDSGNGLTQEEIYQINEPFDYDVKKMQHGNRGIGLRYVKAMLDSFYEGETNLFVNCKKGYGTKITILIPIQEELRNKIKITGVETEKEGKEK